MNNQICEHFYIWYAKECLLEEFGCRFILLGFVLPWLHMGGLTGIIISAIVYALLHFILYSYQMVLVCIPFGLFLGFVYTILPLSWNIVLCIVLHYGLAGLAYRFTSFKDLERKWRK
jgi:membrane protease YdiL (CAAX protease family)